MATTSELWTEIGFPFNFRSLEEHSITFNHKICGKAEHPLPFGNGCSQEALGSLMRCSMGWENHTENVLWHPNGGSGKTGEKLKEHRRADVKSPSDSNYSPRE